jgi:hypothetical protein
MVISSEGLIDFEPFGEERQVVGEQRGNDG